MLAPADDGPGCPGAAVLSYDFWRTQYAARPDILGRAISLDNHPIEVVGVARRGFTGISVGQAFDVLVPLCAEKLIRAEMSILRQNEARGWLRVIGRLRPAIAPEQADARMAALAPEIFKSTVPGDLSSADRAAYLARTFISRPAATGVSYARQRYRRPLLVLMTIVALVLT